MYIIDSLIYTDLKDPLVILTNYLFLEAEKTVIY